MSVIEHKVSARAGLIGNPSDGYGGKTISVPVRNFYAAVRIWERPDKIVIPNDENEFQSMGHLSEYTSTRGFYDAGRLVKAAISVFFDYLSRNNIDPDNRRFEIDYRTNIPRMVGLSGSSAIITATIRCLQDFYTDELQSQKLKPEQLANLVLAAEKEKLGISAGLQDRVVQAFDDLVYMDFSRKAFEKNRGEFGDYKVLDKHNLPNLFLLYHSNPSESGKVHTNLSSRHYNKDTLINKPVRSAMRKFASFTDKFRIALENKDFDRCLDLQNRNFDLRREILGDNAIGEDNLEMISIPRSVGCSSKFTGSGGAVVGIYPNESYFHEINDKIGDKPYKLDRVLF